MALQARVDNLHTILVSGYCVSDSNCVALSSFKSNLQSLEAAVSQPRVKRRHTCSHTLHNEEQAVIELLRVHDCASSDDVGVTTDVLGD